MLKDNNVIYFGLIVLIILTLLSGYKNNQIPVQVEHQIDSAVNKIYSAIKNGKISTVKTATLQHKGDFYYLEGYIKGKSFLINDYYKYDVTYPNEVWHGYFTHIVATNDTHYFLWSENPIETKERKIIGWFLSDGLSKFQYVTKYDTLYLDVLYPVVSRKQTLQ